jgi:hypothetical protein
LKHLFAAAKDALVCLGLCRASYKIDSQVNGPQAYIVGRMASHGWRS